MYHGKHEMKKSNQKRSLRFWRKPVLVLLSLLLVLGVAVGGTVAYLYATDDPITNTFTPTQVPNKVVETIENNVKSDVKIQNLGDIDAYIRVAVLVNWKDEQGNVYGTVPVADADYTITWSGTTDGTWKEGSDGYYYYLSRVKPKGTVGASNNPLDVTSILFTDCKLKDNVIPPTGYYLSVEIVAQSIQADGGSTVDGVFVPAVQQVWSVTVGDDGKLSPATD